MFFCCPPYLKKLVLPLTKTTGQNYHYYTTAAQVEEKFQRVQTSPQEFALSAALSPEKYDDLYRAPHDI